MLPPLPNGIRRHLQESSDIMDIPTMLSVPLRNPAMPGRMARLVISTVVRHSTFLSHPAALLCLLHWIFLDIDPAITPASYIADFQIVFPAWIPTFFSWRI